MSRAPGIITISVMIAYIHSLAFDQSIARVRNLTSIYRKHLSPPKGGRRPVHATDVLRAAVVLLHASLEDLLRGVAKFCIPKATAEVLDKIPLLARISGSNPKF